MNITWLRVCTALVISRTLYFVGMKLSALGLLAATLGWRFGEKARKYLVD
jgi:hypothetical protein